MSTRFLFQPLPILTVLLLLLLPGCDAKPKNTDLQNLEDRVAYGIGYRLGRDFHNREVNIDARLVLYGIQDGMSEKTPLLSEEEIQQALNDLQNELNDKQQEGRQSLAEKNRLEGQAFLAQNRKKFGVKALPSGLQYQVLRPGQGELPGPTSRVKVHYRGQLIDGNEFDSSYQRNQAATIALDDVILGWREALQRMREGAQWRIFLPPDLAYGAKGAGSMIGPEAVLVFEIELLKIESGVEG